MTELGKMPFIEMLRGSVISPDHPNLYVVVHALGHVLEHLGGQPEVAAEQGLQPRELGQVPGHGADALALTQPRVQVLQPLGLNKSVVKGVQRKQI